MKILIIEDERDLADAVKAVLQKNNYTAETAYDGEYGLDCALTGLYDIIILDVMLPKKDGFHVVRELRTAGVGTPVLMLTARGDVRDKVSGLDNGADDYLPKPFHMDELLARLRALGRRNPEVNVGGVYAVGSLEFNPHTLTLSSSGSRNETADCRSRAGRDNGFAVDVVMDAGTHDGRQDAAGNFSGVEKDEKRIGAANNIGVVTVELTLKESQLLELLFERRSSYVPKDTIIEKLWNYDADVTDNLVESQVSLLRRKLAATGGGVTIRTARGVGYKLEV